MSHNNFHTDTIALVAIQVLQLVFLVTCITGEPSVLARVVLILIVAVVSVEYAIYLKNRTKNDSFSLDISSLACCLAGTLATYLLSNEIGLGPVGAASAVGTLIGMLPAKHWTKGNEMQVAVYCGAFVGMSSPAVIPDYVGACVAGVICGLVLNIAKYCIQGYGGRLGTIAFASVGVFTMVDYMVIKLL